uniref:Putative polyprotein n=1 Tax=Tanacetum cinerariifolium TaxID=118510 RepID=A0A699RPK1_TANCI|nr:putative polyprotein [Tanacetum cinerariifolium]
MSILSGRKSVPGMNSRKGEKWKERLLGLHDGIFLSQDKYIGDILKKFGYSDVRSSNTPMDKENPWGKDGTGKDVDLHLYRSMIGSLMYLTASRSDTFPGNAKSRQL